MAPPVGCTGICVGMAGGDSGFGTGETRAAANLDLSLWRPEASGMATG
jgi:hypothetical protein